MILIALGLVRDRQSERAIDGCVNNLLIASNEMRGSCTHYTIRTNCNEASQLVAHRIYCLLLV